MVIIGAETELANYMYYYIYALNVVLFIIYLIYDSPTNLSL